MRILPLLPLATLVDNLAQPTPAELTSKDPHFVNMGTGDSSASAAPGTHSLGPGPALGRRAARIYSVDPEHWEASRTWL